MERAANLCLYSYLWSSQLPSVGDRLADLFDALTDPRGAILQNAAAGDRSLADSRVGGVYYTERGGQAFFVTHPEGGVTLVYRGSGSGEWRDNGLGLSGWPMAAEYQCPGARHRLQYATGQQLQALELACRWAERYGWREITVTGHSKGGNKAQFVALCTDFAARCYSFNGQGFSPEALEELAADENYSARQGRLWSIAADNDYVGVLGVPAASPHRRLFLQTEATEPGALHAMETLLDTRGKLRPTGEQGELSLAVEALSRRVMALLPHRRSLLTVGITDLLQRYMDARYHGPLPPL